MSAPIDIPLAIYVHFPWCVSKCPYCDFNSHALRGELPEVSYVAALARDLAHQVETMSAALAGRKIVSVFLGGGTPSLFSPQAIARVLENLRTALPFAPQAEITLEANPATIERGRFAEYAAAGVNRVSLGAQSFDTEVLRRLGRIHVPEETRRAAEELHAGGLPNFNLDVMYGLPGQDAAGAVRDLQEALALNPAQLSHYHLTLEPGTPFAARPPAGLPDDALTDAMLEACQDLLANAGFHRYEVSAYARPGQQCRHNLVYWRFGDYLGLGAGAHGKLSERDAQTGHLRIRRTTQQRDPRRFQRDPAASWTATEVEAEQRPFEFMLNGLRLTAGVSDRDFEMHTGLPWQAIAQPRQRLVTRGLLEGQDERRAVPTARGLRFLNDVLVEFLPAASTPDQSMHNTPK